MSVSQGFAALLQSALPSSTLVYGVMLPQNCISATNVTAVTMRNIISTPLYVLEGQDPITKRTYQFDCHGFALADADTTAEIINLYLSGGWRGTLSDGTIVQSILRLPTWIEGYRDADRSFVVSLEYQILYSAVIPTPAKVKGSATGPFSIVTGTNDTMLIAIDGNTPQTITLDPSLTTAAQIAGRMNNDIGFIDDFMYLNPVSVNTDGTIQINSPTTGASSQVNLLTCTNSAYATLGFFVADTFGS